MTVIEVEEILVDNKINVVGTYMINRFGLLDVEGDVSIGNNIMKKLPLQFGVVTGNFSICNLDLLSLKGSPSYVGGDFNCYGNLLKNLKYGPTYVGGDYNCSINILKNLKKFNCTVVKSFYLSTNKLKSLKGCPRVVRGSFYCNENPLKSLDGLPAEITGTFLFDLELKSMYTNDEILSIKNVEMIGCRRSNLGRLPDILLEHHGRIDLILKYQFSYKIWDSDSTFNRDNFNLLVNNVLSKSHFT